MHAIINCLSGLHEITVKVEADYPGSSGSGAVRAIWNGLIQTFYCHKLRWALEDSTTIPPGPGRTKGEHIPRDKKVCLVLSKAVIVSKHQVSVTVARLWLAQTSVCNLFKYLCYLSRLLGLRELTVDTHLSWLQGWGSFMSNKRLHWNCLLYTSKGTSWAGNSKKGAAEGGWGSRSSSGTVVAWPQLTHTETWLWVVNHLSCLGVPCLSHPDCASRYTCFWALPGTPTLTLASKCVVSEKEDSQVFLAVATGVWKVSDIGRNRTVQECPIQEEEGNKKRVAWVELSRNGCKEPEKRTYRYW